jgi:hypothetical protein
MIKSIALTAAGVLSLGIAAVTPAAAFHLTPEGTSFKATGKTSATKGGLTLPCKAHFQGHTDDNGVGFVDSGSFTDDGAIGCTAVTLQNLPWETDATGKKTVVIHNVAFSTPIGDCGPGDITGKLKNGAIVFTAVPLPPDCTVSGKLKTNPQLSIVK